MVTEKTATNRPTFVTFESSLPDDTAWDEQGNPVMPGGRSLLESICAQLAGKGWQCGEIRQHSFYGWSTEITTISGMQLIIQRPDSWLLIVTRKPTLWQRIRGRVDDSVEPQLLSDLAELLEVHSGISGARWYTRAQYEQRSR